MEHTLPHDLQNILGEYPISPAQEIQPIAGGLINPTFRVQTAEGAFALQGVHEEIPDSALEDMENVTAYLAEHGFLVPRILRSRVGTLFVQDNEGQRWRLYRWVPGTVRATILDAPTAYKAGKFLGQLHRALATLQYQLKGSISHFHDTAYILQKLEMLRGRIIAVANTMQEESPADLRAATASILEKVTATLPTLLIDEKIGGTRQIIHGDPKASNLLWNEAGEVVGILDCDTFLWNSRLIDIGDAFRSWCKRKGVNGAPTFDHEKYRHAAEGYSMAVVENLTATLHAMYLRATRQLTLELTSRFLIDVDEDYYFDWDKSKYPSRRAHNLARAREYYQFFTTIPESV